MALPFIVRASRPESAVCVIWDQYNPKCESRLMMDALRLSDDSQPSFYVHPSTQEADRLSACRMLTRLGFQAMTGVPEGSDFLVLQYVSGSEEVQLPEELLGRDLVTRVLNPLPAQETMEQVDTSPEPREQFTPLGDGTPTFRSRIPAGTPSLMALPLWAWQ